MERIRVRPAPGRVVPHPETGEPIPDGREGVELDRDAYAIRRLEDGDLVEAKPPPSAAAPAAAAPAKAAK